MKEHQNALTRNIKRQNLKKSRQKTRAGRSRTGNVCSGRSNVAVIGEYINGKHSLLERRLVAKFRRLRATPLIVNERVLEEVEDAKSE